MPAASMAAFAMFHTAEPSAPATYTCVSAFFSSLRSCSRSKRVSVDGRTRTRGTSTPKDTEVMPSPKNALSRRPFVGRPS